MTQTEKDLLLKDLCGRLPYGVVVGTTDNDGTIPNFWNLVAYNNLTEDVRLVNCNVNAERLTYFCDAKPYLFPLSHMTEKQKYDFYSRFIENDCDFDDFKEFYLDNGMWHKLITSLDDVDSIIDWFHKNHLDYRGLIPMGLANDATWKNVY